MTIELLRGVLLVVMMALISTYKPNRKIERFIKRIGVLASSIGAGMCFVYYDIWSNGQRLSISGILIELILSSIIAFYLAMLLEICFISLKRNK